MFALLGSLLRLFVSPANLRDIALENLALRQQLAVFKRKCPRPRLRRTDRFFWVWLSRSWKDWHRALVIVRPEIYSECFRNHLRDMDITEVLTAPQSPWQNPYVEQLVGSIRRECLDHMIVPGEKHLRQILKSYFHYYLGSRTHLSLAKDAPTTRVVQGPEAGKIVEIPQVDGLHHRYERRAAYGKTKEGEYMTQKEAQDKGDYSAANQPCM